jgi:sec-independent protein translocase protein TatA
MDLGAPELIIIFVIILLFFGPGRISQVVGEIGKGIRNFREGLSPKEEEPIAETKDGQQTPPAN